MTTHWTVGRSVEKSSATVGRAMLTLPWSTTDPNMPIPTVPRARYL